MSCFQISVGSLGGQHHSTCYYIEILAVLGVLFDLCFPVLFLQTFCLLSGPGHASVDTLLFGLLFLGRGSVLPRSRNHSWFLSSVLLFLFYLLRLLSSVPPALSFLCSVFFFVNF